MKTIIECITNELNSEQTIPIDLISIINTESDIKLIPIDYSGNFDGRIEYLPDKKLFFIYYKEESYSPRTRFSIGHELGHYYIPEHRNLLIAGKNHYSDTGYISDKRLENEADEFAARLLIPDSYIQTLLNKQSFLTLHCILQHANILNVSISALAFRYVKCTPDRCAIILFKDKSQVCYRASEEMEYIGFKWRGRKDYPANSATSHSFKDNNSRKIHEKATNSWDWFSKRNNEIELWEESFPLGNTGLVLTMLADRSYY